MSLVAPDVLLSPPLMAIVASFQPGLFNDMRPFRFLAMPDTFRRPLTLDNITLLDRFRRVQHHVHAVLTPWLAAYSVSRLVSLVAALPRMRLLVMLHALCNRDLDLVRSLDQLFSVRSFCGNLLDIAATMNDLPALEFLHAQGHPGCTPAAMDAAAKHGNLPMVIFLHRRCQVGCTTLALVDAIVQGHVAVVQYLRECHLANFDLWPWGFSFVEPFAHSPKKSPPTLSSFYSVSMPCRRETIQVLKFLCAIQPVVGFGSKLAAPCISHHNNHNCSTDSKKTMELVLGLGPAADRVALDDAVAHLKAAKAASGKSIRELLRGASIQPGVDSVPAADAKRAKYLETRRLYLQRMQEEKMYNKMLGKISKPAADSQMQREMKSVTQHMSIGLNMIAGMATAFFVAYYVTRTITDNETTRLLAGLGGAIAMMLIEMILYMARATKQEEFARIARKKGN
ncbi:Aste57867_19977 [Aphanomyces stellatus]|uniref:Aste57867_19977 protein n=1 Tax=Aphanomyces stellatus TaxID=120398 RepID=A0A485LE10_9STRA|nr:hypothetical protein As57867_019911 [Aphanomyces stellatus]VFT96674.1 Aste57867_19977 [Aphanomyces stellatus]